MTASLSVRLQQLEEALTKGTADGYWRLMDHGTRHGVENRYEILDDEGSVAVCSDDNDATASTGADRAALIVAAVNALPSLVSALRAVGELAEAWRYKGEYGWGPWQAGEGPDIEGQVLDEAAARLRAVLDPAAHHTEEENR